MWSNFSIMVEGSGHREAAAYIYGEAVGGANGYKFEHESDERTVISSHALKEISFVRILNTATLRYGVSVVAMNDIEDVELDEDNEPRAVYEVGALMARNGVVKAVWNSITAEQYEDGNIDGIRPCDIDALKEVSGCEVEFEDGRPYEPIFLREGQKVGVAGIVDGEGKDKQGKRQAERKGASYSHR